MYKSSLSSFGKNVLTLTIGSGLAQIAPILISPILVQLYSPEDFGIFAIFFALTSIFGTTVNGKYDIATVIPKKNTDAINLAAVSLLLSVFLSFILSLIIAIIFIFIDIKSFFNYSNDYLWIIGLPVAVFFTSLFNLLNYFNTRLEKYNDIAKSKVYKSIALAFSQIGLSFLTTGMSGLAIGTILSNLSANIKLAQNIIKDKSLIAKVTFRDMKLVASEYKIYPLYSNPASLLDIATLQMPLFFIIKISSEATNGYFFLASRIISIPSALIGRSISQVFFQQVSKLESQGRKCMPLLISTIKKLLMIALPIATILFFGAPFLFELVFGKAWLEAGEIAKYLSLIFLIQFPVSSLSNILSLKEFVKRATAWKILYFSSSLILYLVTLTLNLDLYLFLKLYVIHEYFLYSIYMLLIVKSVLQIDREI
ncbi:lipopolysaccharide biosynthesis protein [Candidatus Marinimicrobia bacterium]|nr:lipopolysaccharide biosynthesis protein [Candidatus Neomarinimicrobiota bacterium]